MTGQMAYISLDSPSPEANFSVVGADDGIPYKSMGGSSTDFLFEIPTDQDYLITIIAPVNTSYTMRLTIPRMAVAPAVPEEPTVEPPTAEPPTVEPPTSEPPTVEPPTVEPPTVEPPTVEPPTVEPPTVEPPTVEPPTVEPEPSSMPSP